MEWSRTKAILVLIISAIFVTAGAFALYAGETENERLTGASIILLFGAGILLGAMQLRQVIALDVPAAPDSAAATIELERSIGQKILLSLVFWLIAAGCYLSILSQPDSDRTPLLAWVGVVVGGVGSFVVMLRRIRLTLSTAGLDYSLFKVGPIAWPDIVGVKVPGSFGTRVIVIEVADRKRYFARGFPWHLRLFYFFSSPFRIATIQLGVPAGRVLEAMALRLAVLPKTPHSDGNPTSPTAIGLDRRKRPL